MKNKKFQNILLVILLSQMLLTSCSSMNSNFDCPNQAGVSCKSLDQINRMVDSGELHSRQTIPDTPYYQSTHSNNPEFQSYPALSTLTQGAPIRRNETVQRIWIAPYEDMEGNYHQDNLIYTIVKPGAWIWQPIHSTNTL